MALGPILSPAQDVANKVVGGAMQLRMIMKQQYLQAYNKVWNNKNATPDQVVAQMGSNAQAVFALSAQLASLLVAAGVSGIPTAMPTGWNYTAGASGTVTLTKVS